MKYGLIGEKLGHSFSVPIHNAFGNPEYVLREIPKDELEHFLKQQDFEGLNVTIPYKQDVMPYCILDDAAKEIGAVNTIVKKDGVLYGYNTDAYGLASLMDRTLGKQEEAAEFTNGESAVILGAGGTCKTAIYVLRQKKVKTIYVLARDVDKAEKILAGKDVKVYPIERGEGYPECIKNAEILVNTTPVGMYPKADGMPVELRDFTNLKCVFDVVYNPLTTKLVQEARELGIPSANGLYMLVMQAAFAENLFYDGNIGLHNFCSEIPGELPGNERETELRRIMTESGEQEYQRILCKQMNLVLIGMPGSGKSTVGKLLSEILNRELVDTDTEFEKEYSVTPAKCIETEGEAEFRNKETEVVRKVSARNGLVIATGGGVVTRLVNIKLCKQNGIVVYIKRDITKLSSEGRPLSKGDGAIEKLYEARKNLYEQAADYIFEVAEENPEMTAENILNRIFM